MEWVFRFSFLFNFLLQLQNKAEFALEKEPPNNAALPKILGKGKG